MDLNERKLKILQAIIRDYVQTAEPVGSRTLSKKYDLGVSPATIRNEMSDLEDMGFLTHPHTSAGRVPSEKAYRLYVNEMMTKRDLSQDQKDRIAHELYDNVTELNQTIEHAANVLSEITNLMAFAMTPNEEHETIKFIQFLPVDENTIVLMIVSEDGKVQNNAFRVNCDYDDDMLKILSKSMTYDYKGKTISEALTGDIITTFNTDIEAMQNIQRNVMPSFMRTLEKMLDAHLYMDGLMNIFNIPEYSDIDRAKMFMELINKKDDFKKKLIERDDGLIITIGTENQDEDMKDVSLITATYKVDGRTVGKLGVIGPTRMRYDNITSVIDYITDNLSSTFKMIGGDGPDDGDEDG
ncbi:MAG: heat-inducible transcriptional repressor HrcA [Anaerovoracaceae bacterium]|nr:heat-inducible transcriptional repressor HrcA [Anaerovoracaceae bacterium]